MCIVQACFQWISLDLTRCKILTWFYAPPSTYNIPPKNQPIAAFPELPVHWLAQCTLAPCALILLIAESFHSLLWAFPILGSPVQCNADSDNIWHESEDWWSIFWSLIVSVARLRAKHIVSFLPPQDRKPLVISPPTSAAYSIFVSLLVNYNHLTRRSGSFLYFLLWWPRLRVIASVKFSDNPSTCRWCFHTVSLASLSGSPSCGGSHQYHTLTLFGNTLVATSRATQSQPSAKPDHSNPNNSHT